jgi:hypothetical protein
MKQTKGNKMFKKSLVALAVSGAVASVANAAVVSTNTRDLSLQGIESLATVQSDTIGVTLEAEYSFGDILTFEWIGAEVAPADLPNSVSVTLTCASDTMTLGLLGTSTVNEAVYRVTELDTANCGTTIGGAVSLASLEFDKDTVVTAGSVSVRYTSVTGSGGILIEGPETGALFTTSDQFAISGATPLDAVIDVDPVNPANSRRIFEGTIFTDDLSATFSNDTALTYAATLVDYTIVLTGDFAFLDTDPATAGIQAPAGSVTNNYGTFPVSVTANEITWTGVPGDVDVTIDVSGIPAGAVVPTQTFAATVDVNYTDHGIDPDPAVPGDTPGTGVANIGTDVAVGEWTINGSIVNVPYLPMGPNTQPILRHTNIGTADADISMRYILEGTEGWVDAGVIASSDGPGVTNILSAVEAALLADGLDRSTTGFKVALEFTTNAPASDITVFAAAKISADEQDRVTIGAFDN